MSYTDEEREYDRQREAARTQERIADALEEIVGLLKDANRLNAYDEAQMASVRICGMTPDEVQDLMLFAKSCGWRHPHGSGGTP